MERSGSSHFSYIPSKILFKIVVCRFSSKLFFPAVSLPTSKVSVHIMYHNGKGPADCLIHSLEGTLLWSNKGA